MREPQRVRHDFLVERGKNMNIISKKKQGVIAIICAIAMIVTSLTIYNPREAKAAATGSGNGKTYSVSGESREGGLDGFVCTGIEIHNTVDGFIHFAWGMDVKQDSIKAQIDNKDVSVYNSNVRDTFLGYNQFNSLGNGEYQIKISATTSGDNAKEVYATATLKIETAQETTTRDPSIVVWKTIDGDTGYSYNDNTKVIVRNVQKPEWAAEKGIYMEVPAGIAKVTVNGKESGYKIQGAGVIVYLSALVIGENTINIVYDGTKEASIVIKSTKEVESTTPAETTPYKDGEVLVNESNVTKEVPAYEDGDYWQSEYNNTGIRYVQGKKYVAEVVVSSTATKKIKMVFQRVGIWDFVDANSGYEAEIAAGNKVKITYVFEATQKTDNGNFDIYLGSVADATTLVFESKKLTTYNEVPAGVQTGIEVVPAPATYTVTVDGAPTSVAEGSTYTFGDNAQGYYDTTNSVAYASGEKITVNSDITVTSIKLNVAMQKGASVRLATPTGLRFQTVITSGNDIAVSDILNKDFVTTGTLITTFDLFSANGNVLDKDSKYTKLDIANSGWYNDEVGKFCGSIIEIKTDNYEKKFVGVGYATITYHNGDKYSIYADVNETDNARSIYYVANAVKEAGYKNCDAAQKAIIDKYLAKEAF